MDNFLWILWLVLGIGLIVAEVFTLGFVLLGFGIGAIAAALTAMLGGGFVIQFTVFAVTSVFLTVMSRTIFAKYNLHFEKNLMRSGVDALPGKIGTVTAKSQGALNEAAVKVFGSVWTAYPVEGESLLTEGEKVEVVEVRGSSIYVRRAERMLPDWRGD